MNNPNLFSLGSLRLSHKLIKSLEPAIALKLNNITFETPVPHEQHQDDNRNTHLFDVKLIGLEIRAIVEALVANCEENSRTNTNPGQLMIAKALIDDWMALATHMIQHKNLSTDS